MKTPWSRAELPPTIFDAYKFPSVEEWAAALAAAPVLPKVGLPPLSGADGPCPKCGSHALTIEYHRGMHQGCADLRMVPYPWPLGLGVTAEHIASRIREGEAAVEHHDRRCANCGYVWAEAVL